MRSPRCGAAAPALRWTEGCLPRATMISSLSAGYSRARLAATALISAWPGRAAISTVMLGTVLVHARRLKSGAATSKRKIMVLTISGEVLDFPPPRMGS